MSQQMPSFFDHPGLQLLLFGGKGGVGKTTCATAAALRLSALAPSRSLLLVSTDPAHSVRDSLAGHVPPGNLEVLEFDPRQSIARFRERSGPTLREIAAAGTLLDDQDINRFLGLALPGLDELMAFFEIASWVEARRYLVAAKWKPALERPESLLRDSARFQCVPVTIAEPLAIRETLTLYQELIGRKIPVSELVVNRLHFESHCAACSAAAAVEQSQIQQLLAGIAPACSVWGI